jgi:peroxiredoxin Q/BCP
MPISANISAPDFTLPDETGKPRQLSSFRGKPVVLYFYPNDDTPGCTTEACKFRDDYDEFVKAGITILGVSPNSPQSHARFKEKYQLPFSLLADEGHHVCELYGVWGTKKKFDKEYDGVFRTTFIIAADGTIQKVFEDVKPSEHTVEVLAELGK